MTGFRDLTLYVIRHGECEHNVAGRAAAHNDSPLTPKGREQARANGRLLRETAGELSRFSFYASSLHRTCSTMELVRESAGLAPAGYLADRRLMEIDFGDHTWMRSAEIPPGELEQYRADRWNYQRPGGESWAMVHARIGRFLETLSGDSIIVTHAGTARMFRAHCLGLGPQATLDYVAPHAGILRLQHGSETYFGD